MLEHVRSATRALVGDEIQRALLAYETRYGARSVVRLTVTQFLSLRGEHVLDLRELQSRSARTAWNFKLAVEEPTIVPGWRIELDDNARRTRLKCTRLTHTPSAESTPTAPS